MSAEQLAEFRRIAVPDHATSDAWTLRGEWRGRDAEGGRAGRGPEDDPRTAALVFYLHPTTAPGPDWFADPMDPRQVEAVTSVTEEHLVAFPGWVWAPRYRQTTTRAFFELADGGETAYDLAYADVAAAFSQFLADDAEHARRHPGPPRPIVLAGHSQGARHLMTLVQEFFDDEGLADRLVAVYPIGIGVAEGHPVLSRFPAAGDPDSPGVVICFRATLEKGATPVVPGVCLNPLTCSVHLPDAPASWHRPATQGPLAGLWVAARVRGDFVLVDPVEPGALDALALPGGGLHRVELQLFAHNLRADLRRRLTAWRARRPARALPSPEAHLHHLELGPRDGNVLPVVLLHKLGGWSAEWRDVARLLAADRHVLVVDLPGHGGSSMPGPAPWVQWPATSAELVLRLLDHLGLTRVHLVGSSLGGVVSAHVAAAEPNRVASLSLVGTSLTEALSATRTLELDRSARPSYAPGWRPLPGHHGRAATRDPVVLEDLDASRARAGAWVRPSERGVGLSGVAPLLPGIGAPVLLLNGERAGYRAYEEVARQRLRSVRVETVADAGSFPHQERPEPVAALLRDFLTGTEAD